MENTRYDIFASELLKSWSHWR